MDASATSDAAVFELPLTQDAAGKAEPRDRGGESLSAPLLLRNVQWFCRLRWLVIVALAILEVLGWIPGLLDSLGLKPQRVWPAAIAAILALVNLGYLAHFRALKRNNTDGRAKANLWTQIVVDLILLSAVVHFVGSVETHIAYVFLFHIVLACIFFSGTESLVVTLLASGLYVLCVSLEEAGVLAPAGFYRSPVARQAMQSVPGVMVLNVTSAVAVWVVVWYLASHLSDMVRDRDRRLEETNKQLIEVQKQKTQHMLHTTHELKAPFAAIHANAQLLTNGYCGELPEEAMKVAEKISARSRRLASDIQDMLQLANLQTVGHESLAWRDHDLSDVLRKCLAHVEPLAVARNVRIEADLKAAVTYAVRDHLTMMLGNLLSNAVNYSRRDGVVRVLCESNERGAPHVRIQDEGIGIPAAKLPHIFDEYYRTEEAVMHNKESSGLGLAIVAQAARVHNVRLQVRSRPDEGTCFDLWFRPAEGPNAAKTKKEV